MTGKMAGAIALALGMAVGAASAQPAAQTTRVSPSLTASSAQPAPQAGTLTIAGTGFGPSPFVTLDLVPTRPSARRPTTEIVATAPISLMPPGDYVLTVRRGSRCRRARLPRRRRCMAARQPAARRLPSRSGAGTRPEPPPAAVRTNRYGTDPAWARSRAPWPRRSAIASSPWRRWIASGAGGIRAASSRSRARSTTPAGATPTPWWPRS